MARARAARLRAPAGPQEPEGLGQQLAVIEAGLKTQRALSTDEEIVPLAEAARGLCTPRRLAEARRAP